MSFNLIAVATYMDKLNQLLERRSTGTLTEKEENARNDELDDCWRALSDAEVLEVERRLKQDKADTSKQEGG